MELYSVGHFPPANQAGRLAGPVFYVYVFSLGGTINIWELGNNSYDGGGGGGAQGRVLGNRYTQEIPES
jgi:hypothetical protein